MTPTAEHSRAQRKYLASMAALAFFIHASPSFSATTVQESVVQSPDGATSVKRTVIETSPSPPTETSQTSIVTEKELVVPTDNRTFHFTDFDINHDGILTLNEIGEKLFKIYDTDGNDVIDNVEYERRAVVTIVPVEKSMVISYDFDGDGLPDKTEYTYETVMRDTLLTRFDKNKDGLSPHEFTHRSFLEADVNHDKAIDVDEWRGSYIHSIDKENKKKARFNK